MSAVTPQRDRTPADRPGRRALDLVWLVPVVVATVAALLVTDRLSLTAPLLAVALVPWAFEAGHRPLPTWLFGVLALAPVAVLLTLQGLGAGVFLGTTALCLLASRSSRAWQLAAVTLLAVLLPFLSALAPGPFDRGNFYFALGDLFGVTVGVLLGHTLRLTAELRAADARLLEARTQQERTRLARDVHDLVAHSLTVVVLHVGGARRILRTAPDQAERALEDAERVCRESLDGIRRIVGLLRSDDEVRDGTADLAGLVETYTAAGVQLDADLDRDLERLPLFLRSLVHRVAQEALANAARYRRPDSVVDLTCRLDEHEVSVAVGNATDRHPHASAGGYGLVGLREQVADAGGVLTSRYDQGRWLVTCRLPLLPFLEPAPAGTP